MTHRTDLPSPGRTALYRLYDAEGQLLYVGIATNPQARWARHTGEKPWWHAVARKAVEWYDSRDAALEAEKRVTAAEKPRYDQSARVAGGQYRVPKADFTDYEGEQRLADALREKIKSGEYEVGRRLRSHVVAKQQNVAPVTAASVMSTLAEEGLLHHELHGNYLVAGGTPRPAPTRPRVLEPDGDEAELTVTACAAPTDVAEVLGVPPGASVMEVRKLHRDDAGQPKSFVIEYHKTGYRLTKRVWVDPEVTGLPWPDSP